MPATNAANQKLLGLQYLRAAAALMIAYLHTTVQIPQYSSILRSEFPFSTNRLNAGVDIFFVVSGFIMVATSSDSRPGNFLIRRITRIVPLYWILTTVFAVLYVLAPTAFRTSVMEPEHLLKSLLFIPYPNPAAGNALVPVLIPGWTLNLEMFFYLIFTLLLFARRWRFAIATLVFVGTVILGQALDLGGRSGVAGFYASPQILEFWVGMLIAEQYLRGRLQLPRLVCWVLIVAGFVFLLLERPYPYGVSVASSLFPAAAIVLGVVALEQGFGVRFHPLAALLGDASYSIYLTQIFWLVPLRMLWVRFVGTDALALPAVAFGVSAMVLVCAGAVLTYRLVERPLLHVAHRVLVGSGPSCVGHST